MSGPLSVPEPAAESRQSANNSPDCGALPLGEQKPNDEAGDGGPLPMQEELEALRSQLQAVDQRLGELAERQPG